MCKSRVTGDDVEVCTDLNLQPSECSSCTCIKKTEKKKKLVELVSRQFC